MRRLLSVAMVPKAHRGRMGMFMLLIAVNGALVLHYAHTHHHHAHRWALPRTAASAAMHRAQLAAVGIMHLGGRWALHRADPRR